MKIYDYQGKKNVSGEMIRQLRIKKRMSQSDLAARLQVEGVMLERDSISRIESGTRFVADYELFIFAKVFGGGDGGASGTPEESVKKYTEGRAV